ncbi:hypothetical protein FRX31_022844 [Thalictrum thalictroides]|uniref:Uncharacterized protein n=1 Tax=Thalictrum thalictroides TaxID=46969 RepID=A0A7J6VSM5_THATH|nr:hypothetical protein FRX31_022844 [Thalictrum thalictroides]
MSGLGILVQRKPRNTFIPAMSVNVLFQYASNNLEQQELDGFDDLEEKEKSCSSSSSSESNECGSNSEKLTRAQRKRFRKKKLKEASSRRQNIIGPLLPTTANGSSSIVEVVHQDELQEPQSISNVVEESKGSNVGNLNQGSGSDQSRLKQRRTAKRRKQQVVVDALCQVHSSCSNANEETSDNRPLGNEET